MNISAVSMAQPNFGAKKMPSHYEKGPNGEIGTYTNDGEGYVFFTPAKTEQVEEKKQDITFTPYEKGPNGELGVWSKQGEDAFFIPASEIEARQAKIQALMLMNDLHLAKVAGGTDIRESNQDYQDRKKYSTEWCM